MKLIFQKIHNFILHAHATYCFAYDIESNCVFIPKDINSNIHFVAESIPYVSNKFSVA